MWGQKAWFKKAHTIMGGEPAGMMRQPDTSGSMGIGAAKSEA